MEFLEITQTTTSIYLSAIKKFYKETIHIFL